MDKRVIMRIEVEPESKTRLDEYCDRTGMTKVAAVSRLIDWFCEQPDMVQAIVQRLFPALIEADAALLILKRLTPTKNNGEEFKSGNGHRIGGRSTSQGRNGAQTRIEPSAA